MKCPTCFEPMLYDSVNEEYFCVGCNSQLKSKAVVLQIGQRTSPGTIVKMTTAAGDQTYPGGKNQDGVYQRIINQIPPHTIWVECCAGSAAITRRIKKAEDSYCIELDEEQAIELKTRLHPDYFVCNGNFMELLSLAELAADDYFLFIDPPYRMAARTNKKPMYRQEWSEEDHMAFLLWLQQVECKVLLTHPEDELYSNALEGWRTIDYEYMSHAGKRKDRIWMNYLEPTELHDYTYLGNNRTERQQIERLTARWKERFEKTERLTRGKILTSLQESFRRTIL